MRTGATSPALVRHVLVDMSYLQTYVSNDLKRVKHDHNYFHVGELCVHVSLPSVQLHVHAYKVVRNYAPYKC